MKLLKSTIILLSTFIFIACAHSHDDHDHDHDHDDFLILSAYSDNYELFVEAEPFALNNEGKMTVHLTQLSDFKPITEGSLTATLKVGNETSTQTVNSPAKAGIYLFSLKPKATAKAQLIFELEKEGKTEQFIIDDLYVFEDKHEAEHAAHDAHISSSNGVAFSKDQSWKIEFATEVAEQNAFAQVIRSTGQIQASQTDEKIVAAKTSGIVSLTIADLVEGKAVRAGQTLFAIDASGMADNNLSVRLSEAETEYKRSKAEYERKAELAKENIISQSEFLQIQSELSNAETNLRSLKQNFSAGRQSISAPSSGYITAVMVENGQYVEAGQPLVRVSQNQNLLITAELQSKYYASLSQIETANFTIMDSKKTYSLEELNGKVLSYGRSSDVNNPLIPVQFQVRNSAELLPGSFVDLYIKLRTSNNAITVPNGAIVEEMGTYFAFVQLTPEYFEKRPIKKGASDGFYTEILEGINAGERIVSKGAIFVKLAQAAGALDPHAGHMH